MKILVSAAKTGGHIFPAIAVGHEISKLGHDVIFMGSGEPIEVNALKATKFKYFVSSMQGFRGKNIFAKIKSLTLIPISVFTTIRIIRNEKIDAMVGFGGFITVPIGLAFFIARKPIIINLLKSMQFEQHVRTDGPESHYKKSGTPTMGGLLILSSLVISTLLWADLQ